MTNLNSNYWYHLTNEYVANSPGSANKVLTVVPDRIGEQSAIKMLSLSKSGEDDNQLWRIESLPDKDYYRIYNKAMGDIFCLDCNTQTAVIGKTRSATQQGQHWHIPDSIGQGLGQDWYFLTNRLLKSLNQRLDSSLTAPTIGPDNRPGNGGQHWRFVAMKPVRQLSEPPKELFQPNSDYKKFYDKYILCSGGHIIGTRSVSNWAMLRVENVINNMVSAFATKNKKVADIITIVINKDDYPVSKPYYPLFENRADFDYNYYRGGTNDMVVVTEEMICRTGVPVRYDGDSTYREYDQVVHEWGHRVESLFNLADTTNRIFPKSEQPREEFAWAVEKWFNANESEGKTRRKLKAENQAAYDYLGTVFNKNIGNYLPTLYHKLF